MELWGSQGVENEAADTQHKISALVKPVEQVICQYFTYFIIDLLWSQKHTWNMRSHKCHIVFETCVGVFLYLVV